MRLLHLLAILMALAVTGYGQSLIIVNGTMVEDQSRTVIYDNGQLNNIYNDTIYNIPLNCRSGDLEIINNTVASSLILSYSGFPQLNFTNTYILTQPFNQPFPSISAIDTTTITIIFNCPDNPNNYNYYNKISLFLPGVYHVSFLLDCDPNNRHKPFQYGYLILTALNAIIIMGVAMNSHIWSLEWNGAPLSIQLKWIPFAVFNVVSVIMLIGFILLSVSDFSSAFKVLRYVGIGVAAIFMFICFNQCFYLIKKLRVPVFKVIRWCDLASITCSSAVTVMACFIENWILYDIMATCICVGCIKLFYFDNLRQAYTAMGIYVGNVTTIAIALHYILKRSYNDYATELSSPLFLEVPDLIDSLFKKCSWLVVVDVIVPGVALSYLRMYDQNRSSPYGGIYTVWGNITFVLSTALWTLLEVVYPFSIPFCLVTYLCLMVTIFLIAWRRNEWKTLREGTFEKSPIILQGDMLMDRQQRFSNMVQREVLQPLQDSLGNTNQSSSKDSLGG